jgi:hypothetical protein
MIQPQAPQLAKIVALEGRFDLLWQEGDGRVIVYATVPFNSETREIAMKRAELLGAAAMLFVALLDLIEHAQPDGWTSETSEGTAWQNAFIAIAKAGGQEISHEWASPNEPHD